MTGAMIASEVIVAGPIVIDSVAVIARQSMR